MIDRPRPALWCFTVLITTELRSPAGSDTHLNHHGNNVTVYVPRNSRAPCWVHISKRCHANQLKLSRWLSGAGLCLQNDQRMVLYLSLSAYPKRVGVSASPDRRKNWDSIVWHRKHENTETRHKESIVYKVRLIGDNTGLLLSMNLIPSAWIRDKNGINCRIDQNTMTLLYESVTQ